MMSRFLCFEVVVRLRDRGGRNNPGGDNPKNACLYFPQDGRQKGVRCCVLSWMLDQRAVDDVFLRRDRWRDDR